MPRPPNPHPYKKTVTRWRLPSGKEVKANTEGAAKHTEKSSTYYADVKGRTIALKTTDIGIAWKRLRDRLREEHERELGVRDHYSDHAKIPLLSHLAAWLQVLKAKGTGEQQRQTIEGRLRRLFVAAKWGKLAHIDTDKSLLALAKLQEKGQSAQTRNHYITHLRGFCAWLVRSGRLPQNPVVDLAKVNPATDRRHQRRVPTRIEIVELFRYLGSERCSTIRGMTGPQRRLGYLVAMATGYRADELRSLSVESFDLAAATVTLAAADDKRRRGDVHPLPPWIVEELREWFAGGGATWENFPAHFPGRVLKADLAAARSAWIAAPFDETDRKWREESPFLCYRVESPDGPLFWDFHALRVYYITELANMPGMDVKTLMTLARHTTPQLSLNVYAKAREENLRAAVNQLQAPQDRQLPSPENH